MSTNDHGRWSEDLAPYALGALEPGEAAALERHLEGCERCRSELRWLEPAVQPLPESVERQEPPQQLREDLMAEVRADARRVRGEGEERSSRLLGWLHGGRSPRLAAGFAAVALVVAAAAGYEVGKGGSGGGGETALSSRQAGGVTVKVVREGDGGTLRLADVHRLPRDKVLEAWVQRDGEVEAVPALFVPDRNGRAETQIADMSGVEAVMVTAEPRGGSKQPTSKPIVTMSMPQ